MRADAGLPREADGAHGFAARRRQVIDDGFGSTRGWVRFLLGQADFLAGRLDRYTRIEARSTRRLVFVCLGNINRSAFAGAVARQRGARAVSIGLSTGTGAPATPQAIRCAAGHGVGLGDHAATDITDYRFLPGDRLLVMETRHVGRLAEHGIPAEAMALLGHWASPHRIHLHDPHTLPDAYYRTCFALIHSAVGRLAEELTAAGSPCMACAEPVRGEAVPAVAP